MNVVTTFRELGNIPETGEFAGIMSIMLEATAAPCASYPLSATKESKLAPTGEKVQTCRMV